MIFCAGGADVYIKEDDWKQWHDMISKKGLVDKGNMRLLLADEHHFNPVDEPLIEMAFRNKAHGMIEKSFGRNLWLPKPHVLLATKLNSVIGLKFWISNQTCLSSMMEGRSKRSLALFQNKRS